MQNDVLTQGFDAPITSVMSNRGFQTRAPSPHPSTPSGLMGFLSKMVNPVIQTGADVSNAIGNAEVKLGNALGVQSKTGTQTTKQQFGNLPVVGGQIKNNTPKQFLGNLAQTAAFAVPGGEAGLASKAAQGVRAGALAGGGNALANNGNAGSVVRGAITGGLIGGATGALAKPVMGSVGKVLGMNGKNASSTATSEATATAAPTPTLGQKIGTALTGKGQQTEAKIGSYFPGQKVGNKQLSVADSQKISQTLQNEGINALGAPERMAQVEGKLSQYGQAISSMTGAHNAALSTADKVALQDAFRTRLNAEAGSSSQLVQSHAGNFLNEVLQRNDLVGINKYKNSLDSNILNWNKNPLSATPGQQIAAQAMRSTIRDFMNSKVPGLADTNAKYAALSTAHEALANASGKLANITTGGEGLYGRLLSGETAEKAKAAVGRSAQRVGNALTGTAKTTVAPAGAAPAATEAVAPEVAPGGAADLASRLKAPEQAPPQTTAVPEGSVAGGSPTAPMTPETPLVSPTPQPTPTAGGPPPASSTALEGEVVNPGGNQGNQTMANTLNTLRRGATGPGAMTTALLPQQGTQPTGNNQQALTQLEQAAAKATQSAQQQSTSSQPNVYPEENMLYDIERDPAHASTYEALYKLMNPVTKQTAAAQNAVLAAEDTQSQVNAYQQALSQAGGSKGGILGSLEKLAGETKLINTPQAGAAAAVNQARNDLGAQLAKLVTGTGKPAESVIEHYTNLIPTTTDTPQAAKAKFSYIESLVNDMKSNAQGQNNAGSSTDISSQLDSLLTGGQ